MFKIMELVNVRLIQCTCPMHATLSFQNLCIFIQEACGTAS